MKKIHIKEALKKITESLKPNYKVGQVVLMDMGDGTNEKLTIAKIVKYHPPAWDEPKIGYYSKEEGDNMLFLEDSIIKPLTEAKIPGVDVTNKVQKEEDKVNKQHYKDVAKKLDDYDSGTKKGTDPVKTKLTDKEKEFVNNVGGGKGMQHIEYDLDPSDEFKDRAKKAMTGDSTMGNAVTVDEENGNTDSVWGASDNELGQKLVDRAKDFKEKTDDAKIDLVQFGDDIEVANSENKKIKRKQIAVENVQKMKSKKFIYKKEFNGVDNAIKLIPESYKSDGYKFQMTDGVETFTIKWEGSLTEGEAVVLQAQNKTLINEDKSKMHYLSGYDSKEVIKSLSREDKLNENDIFLSLLSESKKKILSVNENEINLTPKEESILSDILGEDDGSMNMMDETPLSEGLNFNSVVQKVKSYGKKGLLSTALIAALFSSTDSFSQEEQSELSKIIQVATGLKIDNDVLADLFVAEPELKGAPLDLTYGRYGKFGDKYFNTISSGYDTNEGTSVTYEIMINHHSYQENKGVMKEVVKLNYALKEKYGKVTFEFYGLLNDKRVKRGTFTI